MFKSSHFNLSSHKWPAIIQLALALTLASLGLLGVLLTFHPAEAQTSLLAGDNSLIWPLSGSTTPDPDISSPFGPRWQASQSRYDYHPGLDIVAPLNSPIHVITDGVVSKVGWLSESSGLTVIVYHPNLNLHSAYLHLNATSVVTSQTVTQGQVIGLSGDTGITDFAHLHFETRLTLTDYPTSTRNPMGYLPRPDVTTPTIYIDKLQADPIYNPTVTLVMTTTRTELDLNQVRVTLHDRATGGLVDDQFVDFNQRLHTGADTLDQDGIRLIPSPFNASSSQYMLTATFYNLHGLDSFTLTAQAIDLAGYTATATTIATDTTPPGKVTSLSARRRRDGGVDLQWLAPGDSDDVGQALAYEIRYANEPINSFVWSSATPLPNPPAPLAAGSIQTWTILSSLPDPVYFALRTRDQEGNISLLSNSARTLSNIFLPIILKTL